MAIDPAPIRAIINPYLSNANELFGEHNINIVVIPIAKYITICVDKKIFLNLDKPARRRLKIIAKISIIDATSAIFFDPPKIAIAKESLAAIVDEPGLASIKIENILLKLFNEEPMAAPPIDNIKKPRTVKNVDSIVLIKVLLNKIDPTKAKTPTINPADPKNDLIKFKNISIILSC
jgi:hypothetical protein